MNFNDTIKNKYNFFKNYFDIIDINGKNKKYIISLYNGDNLFLRSEYIYIGTYSRSKNFWIWSDQSFTLDKSMKHEISNIRKKLLQDKLEHNVNSFIEKNYTIITSIELYDICKIFDNVLNGNILYINEPGDIIDIILITKILHNNIK